MKEPAVAVASALRRHPRAKRRACPEPRRRDRPLHLHLHLYLHLRCLCRGHDRSPPSHPRSVILSKGGALPVRAKSCGCLFLLLPYAVILERSEGPLYLYFASGNAIASICRYLRDRSRLQPVGRATAGPIAWTLRSDPTKTYKQWEAEQLRSE